MERCAICMEASRAPCGVAVLPCGHTFHEECILAGEVRIGWDGRGMRPMRRPQLARCPLCRRAWNAGDVRRLEELSWEQLADLPGSGSLPWRRFRDPATGRAYWAKGDAGDCFWEGDARWEPYQFAGRKWWWNGATGDWFFADTGAAAESQEELRADLPDCGRLADFVR
jgi:hypothetical protein